MKKITYIIGWCLFMLFSCVDNDANLNYISEEEALPVQIGEMKLKLEAVQGERFRLAPEVLNAEEGRYEYSWSILSQNSASSPVKTLLATTKELDVKITLPAGDYYLYFEVKDRKKDIYRIKRSSLTILASAMGKGWYVLKDKNNETDFDYINAEGKITADVLAMSSKPLKGTAKWMAYQGKRYTHTIPGSTGGITTLTNQQVFHILSSEDIRTVNANTLEVFKTLEEEFYSPLATCKPEFVWSEDGSGNTYLINSSRLYSITDLMPSIGKFGAARVGDYSLFPYCMTYNHAVGGLVFDTKTCTFFTTTPAASTLTELSDQSLDGEMISMQKMPFTMQAFSASRTDHATSKQGFAILKSTEDDSYRIAEFLYGGNTLLKGFNELDANSLLLRSSAMACASTGRFIYFALDNKLYYYMNAPGLAEKEHVLVTLPAGETVVSMQHMNATRETNVMAVLANTSTHWKLYIYEVQAPGNPELETSPIATYTGEGTGRLIICRIG